MRGFFISKQKLNGKPCTIYRVPNTCDNESILWEPIKVTIVKLEKVGIAIGQTPLYLGKPVSVYKVICKEVDCIMVEAPYVADQDDSINIFADNIAEAIF